MKDDTRETGYQALAGSNILQDILGQDSMRSIYFHWALFYGVVSKVGLSKTTSKSVLLIFFWKAYFFGTQSSWDFIFQMFLVFFGILLGPAGYYRPSQFNRISLGFWENYRLCFLTCYDLRPEERFKEFFCAKSESYLQAKGCEYDGTSKECVYHTLEVSTGSPLGEGRSDKVCAIYQSLEQIDSQCGRPGSAGGDIFNCSRT